MESWAELRTISSQASSSRRSGYVRRRLEQRGQGLGPALQLPLGHARPRRLTSTRFEVTPMSMLARAPERSSPCTRVRPSVRRAGQVVGERGHLEVEVVLQVVGLGHDPAEPGLGHQVVGAVHAQQVADQELGRPRPRCRWCGGRAPWRRRAARRRCRSRRAGTRPGPTSRRAPPRRRRSWSPARARPATPRRRGSRPGAGSGASARCGRTCRAGSRVP